MEPAFAAFTEAASNFSAARGCAIAGQTKSKHAYVILLRRAMELTNLGRAGIKVSRLCLGCMTYGTSKWRPWVLNEPESKPFIRRAWELGINFFDTADMY